MTMDLGVVELRSRCRDLRQRWERAVSEKLFYQNLMRAFAVASLIFVLIALVLFFADQDKANAGVTFISGIVSGGLAAFFGAQRSRAEGREQTAWTEYNQACPNDIKAAL